MATRLYIASDLHAAEKAWRKFVNAIRLNVYKADAALLAGDLTGKAIVPIIATDGSGRYETDLFGVHRTARGDEELAALQRDIADVGYYSFVTTAAEAERLSGDEPAPSSCTS
jgi:Icc-related predicted phosphoesterase